MADLLDGQGTGETVIMDVLKTIVVRAHQATDNTQLDLRVSDIVYVLEQDETGWWGGHKEGEEATGWFPGSCVRPVFEGAQQLAAATPAQAEASWHQAAPASQQSQPAPEPCSSNEPHRTSVEPHRCAMETDQRSPVRRSLLVASPQRRGGGGNGPMVPGTPAREEPEFGDRLGGVQPGSSTTSTSEARVDALEAENSKLKEENGQLNDTIRMLKRQSDVDQRNYSQMEVTVEQERTRREEIERRLQAEASEKQGLLSEASQLKQQVERLEKEKLDNKAAMKHVEALYQRKLEDKDDELKQHMEHLDVHRRTAQSEKQRVRSLEDEIQTLKEQLIAARHTEQDMEQTVVAATDSAQLAADDTRRRLFPSTASSSAAMPTLPYDRAAEDYVQEHPLISPTATEASRGRAACRSTAATTVVGPGRCASNSGTGPLGQRPPEVPRAASSAPRAGRGAASPGRLGHAHSTSELDGHRPRAASVEPNTEEGTGEDAPPRGCVADKVTMFEQRCQTPRRDAQDSQRRAPGSATRNDASREYQEARPSRNSREDRSVRTSARPALPRAAVAHTQVAAATQPTICVTPPAQAGTPRNGLQAPTMPQLITPGIQALADKFQRHPEPQQVLSGRPGTRPMGLQLQPEEEEEEHVLDQVDMGMSPICRPPQQQDFARHQASPLGRHPKSPAAAMMQEVKPAYATQAQATAPTADLRSAGPVCMGGAGLQQPMTQLSVPVATSGEPEALEQPATPSRVSVLERIRQLEVR